MTGKPTPTPWAIFKAGIGEENGDGIASLWREGEEREANAALIVRAVNAHDELVKRLGELIDAVDTGNAEMNSVEIDTGDPDIQPHPWHEEWLHHARAALALAGETP